MEIEIRLFATLRDYLPPGDNSFSFKRPIEGPASVAAVVAELKLPPEIPRIILVNGTRRQEDWVLEDGDVLSLFPPVAGG